MTSVTDITRVLARLDEAHKLLDEVHRMLTEMRRELLGSARR